MAVDVSDIVSITTTIRATGRATSGFGAGLLVTTDSGIVPVGTKKVRRFKSLAEVEEEFATTTEPYKAARAWFSQVPAPQNLWIARWLQTQAGLAYILGGTIDDPASLAALPNPRFTIGGQVVSPTLTGVATLADLATALQTAIQAAHSTLENVTVVVDGSRLLLTALADDDGDAPDVSAMATDGTISEGQTGIADEIGFTADAGGVYYAADHTETFAEFLRIAGEDSSDGFYYVMTDNGVAVSFGTPAARTATAIADAIASERLLYSFQQVGDAATIAGEGGTDLALLAARGSGRDRILATWSRRTSYKHVSAAARLSGQDFDSPDSVITLAFKDLPGESVDILQRAEATELERKRCNWFAAIAGYRSYANGFTLDPQYYADMRVFLDWFANETQAAIAQLLTTSRKVPQTPTGVGLLTSTVNEVCDQGRRAGGLAAGDVGSDTAAEIRRITGNDSFDGELQKGYLVYFESFAGQSAADRSAREAPAGHVWLKQEGATQSADIHAILLI